MEQLQFNNRHIILNLLGVDIAELFRLEAKYKAIEVQCEFNNGINFPVDKKPVFIDLVAPDSCLLSRHPHNLRHPLG